METAGDAEHGAEKEVLLKLLAHLRKKAKRDKDTAAAKQGELVAIVRILADELRTADAEHVRATAAVPPPNPSPAPQGVVRAASAGVVNSPREMRADDLIPDALAAAENKPKGRPKIVYVKRTRDTYARAVDVDEVERLRREAQARDLELAEARSRAEAAEAARRDLSSELTSARALADHSRAELAEARARLDTAEAARRELSSELESGRKLSERARAEEAEAKRQLVLLSHAHAAELETQRRELSAELGARQDTELARARAELERARARAAEAERASSKAAAVRVVAAAAVGTQAAICVADEACGPDDAESASADAHAAAAARAALEATQAELQCCQSQLGRFELQAANAEARVEAVRSECAVRERRAAGELEQTKADAASAARAAETREAQIRELRLRLDNSLLERDRFAEANTELQTRLATVDAQCTLLRSTMARSRSFGEQRAAPPAPKPSVGTSADLGAEAEAARALRLLRQQSSAHEVQLGLLAAELARGERAASERASAAPVASAPAATPAHAPPPAVAVHEVATSSGDLHLDLDLDLEMRPPAAAALRVSCGAPHACQAAWPSPPARTSSAREEPTPPPVPAPPLRSCSATESSPPPPAHAPASAHRHDRVERFAARRAAAAAAAERAVRADREGDLHGSCSSSQALQATRVGEAAYEPVAVADAKVRPRCARARATALRGSTRACPPRAARHWQVGAGAVTSAAGPAAIHTATRRPGRGGLLSSIASFFSRK